MIITGSQMRAARAILGMTGDELCQLSGVSRATVARAEAEDGPVRMIQANAHAIRRTLESAGVIFIDENGEGPGVRLRKAAPSAE